MLPIIASIIPSVIKSGIELFDKKFKSQAEKDKAVREYQAHAEARLQEAWNAEQKQITARHDADMHSDSWLSKNIRPMVLIYLMALFTLAFFRDVPDTTMQLLQSLLLTTFAFYFGSRTLEKLMNVHTKYKRNG